MIGKVIYSRRSYCKIKVTEDSIEQKQLVNGSISKIEKIALKKSQRWYKWIYDNCEFHTWVVKKLEEVGI